MVTSINTVSESITIAMPIGGIQPPTLYTMLPTSLIRNTEYIEIAARASVAMLERTSENPFILFPSSEFKNALANGIAINKGNGFCIIFS